MGFENLQVGIGRIAEQNDRQCQLGEDLQAVLVDPGRQNAQERRAKNQADEHEHQGTIEQARLDTPGKQAVEQEEGGEEGEVLIHRRHACAGTGFGCQRCLTCSVSMIYVGFARSRVI